jgi:polygalacturonase
VTEQQDDRPAVQETIDQCNACWRRDGHRSSGTYWLEGPLHLKSNVNLHLEAGSTLRFSADLEDFLPVVYTRWEGTQLYNYSPFIYAIGAEDIAITGAGTIDGNSGGKFDGWFKLQKPDQNRLRTMGDRNTPLEERIFGEGHYLRPSFIQFINCERIKLEGVKIIESPFWIIHPVFSKHITIRNVILKAWCCRMTGLISIHPAMC